MEFYPGDWPSALVPLSFQASGLTAGPLLCTEEQRYALEGAAIELPYTCRTKAPHTAEAVIDVIHGKQLRRLITLLWDKRKKILSVSLSRYYKEIRPSKDCRHSEISFAINCAI